MSYDLQPTLWLAIRYVRSDPDSLRNRARGYVAASEKLLPLVYKKLRSLAAARLAREKPGQTFLGTKVDLKLG